MGKGLRGERVNSASAGMELQAVKRIHTHVGLPESEVVTDEGFLSRTGWRDLEGSFMTCL